MREKLTHSGVSTRSQQLTQKKNESVEPRPSQVEDLLAYPIFDGVLYLGEGIETDMAFWENFFPWQEDDEIDEFVELQESDLPQSLTNHVASDEDVEVQLDQAMALNVQPLEFFPLPSSLYAPFEHVDSMLLDQEFSDIFSFEKIEVETALNFCQDLGDIQDFFDEGYLSLEGSDFESPPSLLFSPELKRQGSHESQTPQIDADKQPEKKENFIEPAAEKVAEEKVTPSNPVQEPLIKRVVSQRESARQALVKMRGKK